MNFDNARKSCDEYMKYLNSQKSSNAVDEGHLAIALSIIWSHALRNNE
jgi:hypothetical protein